MAQNIHARRAALSGHRFSVTFYGGWYAVDNHTGRTFPARTMEQVLDIAESKNKGVQA